MNRLLILLALVISCAANVAPELPSGPAELLVRFNDRERARVSFAVVHSWEALEELVAPYRGHDVGVEAIVLDQDPAAGAPWAAPDSGAKDVCVVPRRVQ
jgi:hypothetical protein